MSRGDWIDMGVVSKEMTADFESEQKDKAINVVNKLKEAIDNIEAIVYFIPYEEMQNLLMRLCDITGKLLDEQHRRF